MVLTNPFKPTAGMTPPVLMGREDVIQDFSDGLLEGPGSPGRLMRITGPRGSGKTVLLTELGRLPHLRAGALLTWSPMRTYAIRSRDSCAVPARPKT